MANTRPSGRTRRGNNFQIKYDYFLTNTTLPPINFVENLAVIARRFRMNIALFSNVEARRKLRFLVLSTMRVLSMTRKKPAKRRAFFEFKDWCFDYAVVFFFRRHATRARPAI